MINKYVIAVLTAGFFFLTASLSYAQEIKAPLSTNTAHEECQTSIIKTALLDVKDVYNNGGNASSCSIAFIGHEHISNYQIVIFISERQDFDDCKCGASFFLNEKGLWRFDGNNVLLESRFLKKSFKQEKIGDDTLLIGTQLLRGNTAQGGPMDVPGISILRITTDFVVRAELNFEPTFYEKQNKGYKELREAVSNELVEIVKSVRLTPGQSGPTVRLP